MAPMEWIVAGLFFWFVLLIFFKFLYLFYVFIHSSVQWLPNIFLAWVPGLDILWFFIIILILGRIFDMFKDNCGYNYLCQYFFKRCKMASCDKVKVILPVNTGPVRVEGYILSTSEKDGVNWVNVAYKPCFFWTYKTIWLPETEIVYIGELENN